MPFVRFADVSGRSLHTDLPPSAQVNDACVYIASSLGLSAHQIRILDLDSQSFTPYYPADAPIFPHTASSPLYYFQIVPHGRPSAAPIPISDSLFRTMSRSSSKHYQHMSYARMFRNLPPDLAARLAPLIEIYGDAAKCEDAYLVAHGNLEVAANILAGDGRRHRPYDPGMRFDDADFQIRRLDEADRRLRFEMEEIGFRFPPDDPHRRRAEADARASYEREVALITHEFERSMPLFDRHGRDYLRRRPVVNGDGERDSDEEELELEYGPPRRREDPARMIYFHGQAWRPFVDFPDHRRERERERERTRAREAPEEEERENQAEEEEEEEEEERREPDDRNRPPLPRRGAPEPPRRRDAALRIREAAAPIPEPPRRRDAAPPQAREAAVPRVREAAPPQGREGAAPQARAAAPPQAAVPRVREAAPPQGREGAAPQAREGAAAPRMREVADRGGRQLNREAVFEMLREQFGASDEFLSEQLREVGNDLNALLGLFA